MVFEDVYTGIFSFRNLEYRLKDMSEAMTDALTPLARTLFELLHCRDPTAYAYQNSLAPGPPMGPDLASRDRVGIATFVCGDFQWRMFCRSPRQRGSFLPLLSTESSRLLWPCVSPIVPPATPRGVASATSLVMRKMTRTKTKMRTTLFLQESLTLPSRGGTSSHLLSSWRGSQNN